MLPFCALPDEKIPSPNSGNLFTPHSSPPIPMPQHTATKTPARLELLQPRLLAMQQGASELSGWLSDLAHHGLASAQQQPPGFWDDMARRMVDAKLGGLARRIRLIKGLLREDNWPERVLAELALLHLAAEGFQRCEALPDGLWADLLQFAGLNLKKEDVLQTCSVVDDCWQVLGTSEGEEEKLRFRRTWLVGERHGRFALLLEFAWGRNDFEHHWQVGQVLEGEMAYYASAYPLRALPKGEIVVAEERPYEGKSLADASALLAEYDRALAANPWLHGLPALLEAVVPGVEQDTFYLTDVQGNRLPVVCAPETGWKFVAISAGRPMRVFGEWDGGRLLC